MEIARKYYSQFISWIQEIIDNPIGDTNSEPLRNEQTKQDGNRIDDIKTILELISKCIYLDHPLILEIRWQFHIILSEIEGFKPWPSREEWEIYVADYCQYNLFTLAKSILEGSSFRRITIAVLKHEVEKMEIINKRK